MVKKPHKKRARPERAAVIFSQCEHPLAEGLDMDALLKGLKRRTDVGYVKVGPYPCSRRGIAAIASEIAKKGLARVVVAGSSERLYGKLYRDILGEVGVDPGLVEFANIAEHCILTHKGSKRAATACAEGLIRVALGRVLRASPKEKVTVDVKPTCAVIGGGIAGVSAAAALSVREVEVFLVDMEARLGGLLNELNAVFPSYRSAAELLGEQVEHLKAAGIHIKTDVEPVAVKGHVGDYRIDLSDATTLEVGTIIVATGASLLVPTGLFGYGDKKGVITQLDLEAMLLKAENPGANIVMIQCAGSRNEERPYCSRVCCTASIKNTILIKERFPAAKITILSRGFAEYAGDLDRAREMGVDIIRYSLERPPVVGDGTVEVYDEISDMETHIPFDRVVLAVPMVASEASREMARILKMPTDQFGFLVEPRLKVRPEEYAPRGIFVAGCAHWPSSMTEAILQGYGAASRAFDLIDAGRIERLTYVSHVDKNLCRGCGRCEEACQHGAIEITVLEDGMKQAEVIAIHCTGCGVCTAVCPSGAISLADMSPEQVEAAFEAIGGA